MQNNNLYQEKIKVPLEIMKPPKIMTTNNAKDPKVFATIIFRPNEAITLKSAVDIWCKKKSSRNCARNLQVKVQKNGTMSLKKLTSFNLFMP
jgi:hypothetical protein